MKLPLGGRLSLLLCILFLLLAGGAAWATDPGRIAKGDMVVVAADGTELHVEGVVKGRLKGGTEVKVLEVYDVWVGGTVAIEGKDETGWVLARRVFKRDDPAAVAALKKLPIRIEPDHLGNVWRIDAKDCDITGAALEHVKGLYNLEGLELSGTKVTDADLAHLKGLTNLQWLYLDNTKVSDKGLEHLQGLTNLDVLALSKTAVVGPGLVHLRPLKGLRVINLSDCKISDDGLENIKGLAGIQTLALENTPIDGSGMKYFTPVYGKKKELIEGLPRLNVLNLKHCKLADKALLHLTGSQELRILYLKGAQFDEASKDALDDAIQSLAIFE
jgi:hypothetical protein